MSFVWKANKRLRTPEECAKIILTVALGRGLDEFAAVLAVMCVAQESDFWCPWNEADPSSKKYSFDSKSNDGRSVGYFQQQNGRAGEELPEGDGDNWWGPMASRMDLASSADKFLDRLEPAYGDAIGDANLASQVISNVQHPRDDLRGAYAQHWDRAWALVRGASPSVPPVVTGGNDVADRPDFNEYAKWSTNNEARGGVKVDLFLLHTHEGDGNADSQADFLISTEGTGNPRSYHYTISEDPNDHGVTVVDVVDTDFAAWAVGASNYRSINLCFAGSRASWTREQWLKQSRAIDVAAYLAAQDCKKYGIDPRVIVPPYAFNPPGISDHRYCSLHLQDGNNHTDVGDNFPWDVFTAAVAKYMGASPNPPAPTPAPVFTYPSTEEMIKQIWEQLFGPKAAGWEGLFGKVDHGSRGKFTVEAIADIHGQLPK